MHLGEEIRVKREAMGLSLEELAHQLGVPSWKVANWEVNQEYPSEEQLRNLTTILGKLEEDVAHPSPTLDWSFIYTLLYLFVCVTVLISIVVWW